jgi:hypothetical protein
LRLQCARRWKRPTGAPTGEARQLVSSSTVAVRG